MTRSMSAMHACTRIARLTRRRLLRGKVLWIALAVAVLPVLAIAIVAWNQPSLWRWWILFDVLSVLLVVIPALLLTPWISEEVDDKTITYLWSRPFPRWSLLVGKLVAVTPIVAALCVIALCGSFVVVFGGQTFEYIDFLWRSVFGFGVGLLGWCAVSVGIGGIVPKYGTALVIVYSMFLDASIGSMPFSIQNLALSFHIHEISRTTSDGLGDVLGSTVWVLGLSLIWLGLALWRVSVAEYATND